MLGDNEYMKVLYIGHYKEFGGWSQAAIDNILALDKIGVDVVCRNVTLTQDRKDVDKRILALESKAQKVVIFVFNTSYRIILWVQMVLIKILPLLKRKL